MNIDRLWQDLLTSAAIGPGNDGGLSRLALTDADKVMRDLFVGWCRAAGCTIRIDKTGNVFARRDGVNNALPPVLIGSHLDTQIVGGRYDGVLGVLAGLEVVRTLNDNNFETQRPVEVVVWTNEEGVRFQPPMMGSGAFARVHDTGWVLAQTDDDGLTFGDELCRIGYAGTDEPAPQHYDSYFELHIEQGPVLDAEGVHVGIVTGGFTSHGAKIQIRGENAHSGSTSMTQRRNALVGAALVIAKVNDIGWMFQPDGRAACARVDVLPNKYGILPHWAEITVDVRHPETKTAQVMYGRVLDFLPIAAAEANVTISVAKEWRFGGIEFDTKLVNLIRTVSAELGVSHRHLLSAAGHDAYHLARAIPAAMIFTPCRDGISHKRS
jgi:N-carbamoyl-L-amino-acid hydrolase